MTRLNMRGLLALVLTVLTLGLGQVPASAQVIGRVPYLSSKPCKGLTLSLAFAKSTGSNCLNGQRYGSVTNIPGWTYTGGTPAGTGSYAARADGSLQFFPSYTNLLLPSQQFDNAAWVKTGATVTADAVAAPDGTTTADKLVETAATSTHAVNQTGTVAASSTITASAYFKSAERTFAYIQINDGATANAAYTSFNLSTGAVAQTPTLLVGTLTNMASSIVSVGNGWYRAQFTATLNTTANAIVYLSAASDGTTRSYLGVAGSGIYIWGAQLELGSTASTYIPTTTAAVTVGTPRITDAGYWAEEARTNSIRNSTATNGSTIGVIGSGGALPTNWGHAGGSTAGLTATVVAAGTDAGLAYIDVRYSGTTSSVSLSMIFESTTAIAASAGQVWTSSQYIKLVGGSLANINSIYSQVDGVGGSAGSGPGTTVIPSSTLARMTATYTLGTGATNVRTSMPVIFNNGAAVDVTLRIYQPQLELGSFATSPIPTTSVAVTRAADVGYVSGLVVPSAYTALADTKIFRVPTGTAIFAEGGVTAVSGWTLGTTSSGSTARLLNRTVNLTDTSGGNLSGLTINANDVSRFAVASSGAFGANGQNPTSGTVPSSTPWAEGISIGVRSGGSGPTLWANNVIRRIVIYPRAFGDSELQAATIGPVSFANDNAATDDMKAALWGWVA